MNSKEIIRELQLKRRKELEKEPYVYKCKHCTDGDAFSDDRYQVGVVAGVGVLYIAGKSSISYVTINYCPICGKRLKSIPNMNKSGTVECKLALDFCKAFILKSRGCGSKIADMEDTLDDLIRGAE